MTSGAPGGPRSMSTEGGSMSKLKLNITMSIDGFVAGPGQSQERPLGVGGEQLHGWLVPLKAFRERHGEEGGEVNASTPFAEDILGGAGATIMRPEHSARAGVGSSVSSLACMIFGARQIRSRTTAALTIM